MMDELTQFIYFSEVKEQGFRNEAECEFLTALFDHAQEWFQLGLTNEHCMINYSDSTLMIAFDVCDWKQSQVLRSLKLDFTGTSVLMGETGTNLFDFKFDLNDSKIKVYGKEDGLPSTLANLAAKWLFQELSRQIVRREWITNSYHHTQYEMADTGQVLSWSDSQNKKRFWLGSPTTITIVHPCENFIERKTETAV